MKENSRYFLLQTVISVGGNYVSMDNVFLINFFYSVFEQNVLVIFDARLCKLNRFEGI